MYINMALQETVSLKHRVTILNGHLYWKFTAYKMYAFLDEVLDLSFKALLFNFHFNSHRLILLLFDILQDYYINQDACENMCWTT